MAGSVEAIPSAGNLHGVAVNTISVPLRLPNRAERALSLGQGMPRMGYERLTLAVWNADALPAKKASIDRPSARAQQCQGGT